MSAESKEWGMWVSRTPASKPYDDAAHALRKVWPTIAEVIQVENTNPTVNERMERAGIGLARIVFRNGNAIENALVFNKTPYTEALKRIHFEDEHGQLPPGSHFSAVERMAAGDFDILWADYLPEELRFQGQA